MAVGIAPEVVGHEVGLLGLDRCPVGATVQIVEFTEPDDDDDCRLRELGLYEGAQVKILSNGDPVVLMLLGTRFAVCRRCAGHVAVALVR